MISSIQVMENLHLYNYNFFVWNFLKQKKLEGAKKPGNNSFSIYIWKYEHSDKWSIYSSKNALTLPPNNSALLKQAPKIKSYLPRTTTEGDVSLSTYPLDWPSKI